MTKRILAMLMVLCMVVTLFPLSVFASEEVQEPETVETVVEEPAEEPAEDPVEESVEESAEVPAEEPAEVPAEEPAEEPVEEPVEEPAEDGDVQQYPSGTCGTGLTWEFTLDHKTGLGTEHEETWYKLTVSGNGTMDDYNYIWDDNANNGNGDWSNDSIFAPWKDHDTWHVVKIVIENGVTHIGNHAFRDFNNLESVTIPTSVTSIGDEAFCNCCNWQYDENKGEDVLVGGLQSVEIPTSIQSVGRFAFGNCNALSEVIYGDDAKQIAEKCWQEEGEEWPPYERLGASFQNTPWFEDIKPITPMSGTCGEGVAWELTTDHIDNEEHWFTLTISGDGAMEDYDYIWDEEAKDWSNDSSFVPWKENDTWHIVKIVIKSGVTHIGDHAFRDFNNLESVTIPASVTSIGREAFCNCTCYNEKGDIVGGLSSITIPTTVTSIGEYAFGQCCNLETVSYGGTKLADFKSLAEICFSEAEDWGWTLYDRLRNCFECSKWVEGILGDRNVESIDEITKANAMHNTIYRFTAEESGVYVFTASSTEKTAMDIRRVLGENGEEGLTGCGGTGEHSFYTFLKKGESYALYVGIHDDGKSFDNKDVSVSVSMTNLGMENLDTCGDNLSVSLQEKGDELVLVITGHGAMDDYYYEFDEYGNETENCHSAPWRSISNLINRIVFVSDAKGGITHIGDHAFRDFNNLESVTVPDTVTSIGAFAFSWCENWQYDEESDSDYIAGGLASVVIPASVSFIGERAFEGCENLSSVIYGDEKKPKTLKELSEICYPGEEDWGWTLYDRLTNCFDRSPWINEYFGNIRVESLSDLTTARVMHLTYAEYTPAASGFYRIDVAAAEETGLVVQRVMEDGWYYVSYATGLEYSLTVYLEAETTYIIGTGILDGGSSFNDYEIPVSVSCEMLNAENMGDCGENLTWGLEKLTDGVKLVITGHGDMFDYFYDWDEDGNEIGEQNPAPWRSFSDRICEIEFVSDGQGGITHIGDHAFRDFMSLESVTVPDTVTSIGDFAFGWCSCWTWDDKAEEDILVGLSSVTIPASVEYIGYGAFMGSEKLSAVNYSGTVKQLAAKCCIEEDWSLYDAIAEAFRFTPWVNTLFEAKEVANAAALTEAYSRRNARYFFITVPEGEEVNYCITASCDSLIYMELCAVRDDNWEYMEGESGTELSMNVRLREGKYAIYICLDESEPSFELYFKPVTVTVEKVELTDYEVYSQAQLIDAITNKTTHVGTITIKNDLTVTEDSILTPINENYYFAKLIIPEGVTVTVTEGAYFGAETKDYQGTFAGLLETGLINRGSIVVKDTSELHIFGENCGSIVLEDKSFVRFQGSNYGTLDLRDESSMVAHYFGNFLNFGTLTVEKDATLWSTLVGCVRNCEGGKIVLNGTYYVSYESWENGYNLWLENEGGTFSGIGSVYVYENQPDGFLSDAVADAKSMVNCSTINVKAAELPTKPSYIGEGGLKWALEDNDDIELMVCTDTVSYVTKLTVDGEELEQWEDYYVVEGGLLVFIDGKLLDTLTIGEHTIVISYKNGDITLTLEVVKTTHAEIVVPEKKNGTEVDADTAKEALGAVAESIDVTDTEMNAESVAEALSGSVPAEELSDVADKVAAAAAEGKKISVEMSVDKKTEENLTKEETKLIDAVKTETDKVAAVLDLSVAIKADDESVGRVTQLKSKVTITVELTEAEVGKLTQSTNENTRMFVARIHDGVVELIPATLNGLKLTFETDRFSTFALVKRTYTRGDIDGKGGVDALDLVAMAKYISGEDTDVNLPAVDTNNDGEQNLLDLVLLMKKVADPDHVVIY